VPPDDLTDSSTMSGGGEQDQQRMRHGRTFLVVLIISVTPDGSCWR
jgi:hypothetical protein